MSQNGPRVLIIDDERNFREFLAEALESEGYAVEHAATARAGLARARESRARVVLLDQNLPDRSGLEVLPELRSLPWHPVVIMMTAFAAFPRAVAAVKAGAFQYIAKPFEFGDLLAALTEACVTSAESEDGAGAAAGGEPDALARIAGLSPELVEMKRQLVRIAERPVPAVLVEGESGSGKELVARALHSLSDRSAKPMVCVNCAALTETLLMSELFGHERGAFTDARERRAGVFEAADGGTLFLDEVSEMGAVAQAALLRVLEQRTFRRVGGDAEHPVDVRIIAATNVPLEPRIEDRRFRADLFYRLNVVRLTVPPLRDRGEDVLLLAERFSRDVAGRYGVPARPLADETADALRRYAWPGNVRELRNAIERVYVVAEDDAIRPAHLPGAIVDSGDAGLPGMDELYTLPFASAKRRVTDHFGRRYFDALLRRTGGNVSQAAEQAGMHRQVLQRLLRQLGIDADRYRPPSPSG